MEVSRRASGLVLVCGAGAVDQYVAGHPGYLFDASPEEARLDWPARLRMGTDAVREIVGRVWLYVLLGIAVGAAAWR